MGKRPGSEHDEFEVLASSDIPNPRVLDAILRILRALLWFLDRSPKHPVDSRHAKSDDVKTLLRDLPDMIAEEDATENHE